MSQIKTVGTMPFGTKKRLIVEGNIGAGKSTFLRVIQSHLDLEVIFEPHEQWQNVGEGDNLLELFYNDTKRWAYTFQTYAFISRTIDQEKRVASSQSTNFLFERSVYSDRYCFAKNCFEMGTLSAMEWNLYQEWFSWLDRTQVAGFIYLQTDPTICYERMLKRKRAEETEVPYDYIHRLHEKHENWLVHKNDVTPALCEVPVLVLECNVDFEHSLSEQLKHATAIADFFDINLKESHTQVVEPILYF
jgi:deoxyadenosine/deoxycytidine kinase